MNTSPEELEAQAAAIMAEIATRLAMEPPRINDASFPESDRRHVDTILLMMRHLNRLIDRFTTDLELFDYAEAQELGHRWSSVACRDAVLALKDFRDALGHIADATRQCLRLCAPSLLAAIEAACGSFDRALPNVTQSRHVAAHSANHIGTHKDRERNSLSHVPLLMHMARNGRRVTSSSQGREVSFEISTGTLDILKSIRDAVFTAFHASSHTSSLAGGLTSAG